MQADHTKVCIFRAAEWKDEESRILGMKIKTQEGSGMALGGSVVEEAEEGDKEAEPSRKRARALNPSFSGWGRTLLPWRERESGNCCFVLSFHLLTSC